jgi:hypothetical protein
MNGGNSKPSKRPLRPDGWYTQPSERGRVTVNCRLCREAQPSVVTAPLAAWKGGTPSRQKGGGLLQPSGRE